ncbi:hypothetical protein [Cylindrospermum stagnale]|uniref:hypothetical protein n=1 Tax=Cylindrospermum stagnale TaxID=142864 RepID=UPI0012F6CF71|nr:hypothetical protein [Cylindrospermum stagnale]
MYDNGGLGDTPNKQFTPLERSESSAARRVKAYCLPLGARRGHEYLWHDTHVGEQPRCGMGLTAEATPLTNFLRHSIYIIYTSLPHQLINPLLILPLASTQ